MCLLYYPEPRLHRPSACQRLMCVYVHPHIYFCFSIYVCVFYTVQHNEKIAIVAPFNIRYCGTVPNFNVLSGSTPAQITCTLNPYMFTFNGDLEICTTHLKIAIVAPFDIRYCGSVTNFNVWSGGTQRQITQSYCID